MKRWFRKGTAVACVAALSLLMFAGCQSSGDPDGGGSGTQSGDTSDPVDIHILNRLNAEVIVDNNPIIEKLEEKLNVNIEYEAPPINNYNERLQISMAGGLVPDIIYNWGGADTYYENWAADGLLAELDDKIENYSNIMGTMSDDYWPAIQSTNTGKIHAIPKGNVDNYWGFIINQQWLDNLGIEAPTNLDEFREVAYQFTFNDPDQNGSDDTFGLSYTSTDIFPLKYSFGVVNGVRDADGEHKIQQMKSGYIPYLNYLRSFYADGILDPEFFTNEYNVDVEKLIANTIGMTVSHQVGVMGRLNDAPDAIERFTYIAPMANEAGERNVYITPSMWGAWMISADGEVDKSLELIDYAMSVEGFTLTSLGIEGEHYNSYDYETRTVDRTEEQITAVNSITSSYFTFTFAKEGASAVIENATTEERLDKYYEDFNAMEAAVTVNRIPSIKAPLMTTFGADNPDLVTRLNELEVQYIVGEIELEAFEAFLNDTYIPAAQEMNDEYVEWMEAYESANR